MKLINNFLSTDIKNLFQVCRHIGKIMNASKVGISMLINKCQYTHMDYIVSFFLHLLCCFLNLYFCTQCHSVFFAITLFVVSVYKNIYLFCSVYILTGVIQNAIMCSVGSWRITVKHNIFSWFLFVFFNAHVLVVETVFSNPKWQLKVVENMNNDKHHCITWYTYFCFVTKYIHQACVGWIVAWIIHLLFLVCSCGGRGNRSCEVLVTKKNH